MTNATETVRDTLGRSLRSLRLSVIDRCDLRCNYCMPEEKYVWLPRQQILSFEELERLVRTFTGLGVDRLRLTGGEPLLRRDIVDLVRRLSAVPGIEDVALTTNATQLASLASGLREAGLHRVTVSLDSLRRERFKELTRRDELERVVGGIRAAAASGFRSLKINSVVMKGFNEDEVCDLVDFGREVGAEVRFIEYMDVGGATRWQMDRVYAKTEILAALESRFGPIVEAEPQSAAPARRYRLPDGTTVGIIASVTEPFCQSCDRGRVTADGMFFKCLYGQDGLDLKSLLREGAADAELATALRQCWSARTDRAAEERAGSSDRNALFQIDELKQDPHREMHTRGG
jgi:cyclic pyranopterin phosphate synthase